MYKQDLERPVEGGVHLDQEVAPTYFKTSSRRYSKEAGCPNHSERRRMPCGGIEATEKHTRKTLQAIGEFLLPALIS
jgi:hypothetical protein